MDKDSDREDINKLKALFFSGEKTQMEMALMIAESNEIDLSTIEQGLKQILKHAEMQPRLGQWAHAKMENLIYPLGMVLMLAIEDCEMPEVPDEIGLFRKVGILELHRLGLKKLPATVRFMRNLRSLSLKHNQLKDLPEEIGTIGTLKSLNLHDNLLEKLPDSLFHLQALEVLELSKNPNLKKLPNWIGSLPSLKRLVLDAEVFKREIPVNILPLPDNLAVEWEQIVPKF